jgi:hypothetical protein
MGFINLHELRLSTGEVEILEMDIVVRLEQGKDGIFNNFFFGKAMFQTINLISRQGRIERG